jgi:hypothetical protein
MQSSSNYVVYISTNMAGTKDISKIYGARITNKFQCGKPCELFNGA